MAGFDPSKYGSKKSKIYGSSAADTRVDSGTETGFDPSRYGDSKSKLYSPGSMVITPEPVETQQKKRERQVVSPYGTFLGGFSFAGDRQKTAKELADEKAQQELSEQEYQRLLGLELDKYRTEVEKAGKKAQEEKAPYNIHAFGGYDANRTTEAERQYAAMKADLNKAESLQYDVKGREALDKLTEEQTAALEVLASTEGVPAAAAQADYDRKVAARETLLASGLSEDELSQLVNYQRNIPKREKNAERYAKVQEMARNEGEKSPIGGTLLSVPANLLSGIGTVYTAVEKLRNPDTPADYHSPAMLPYAYASGVRGEVTKNLQYDHGDAAAFAYGVGTSMLDSAATAALAALGVPPAAASATLGGAAATDAMVAAKDRGLDDSHAIVTGVAAGVMESFFEKVSLESLIHMKLPTGTSKQKLAGMLKNAAIQGGIEGSEEMFTDLANLWWDKVINGDMADVEQRINAYMAGGMSHQEAQQKVVGETIKDIAVDFGAGALAGGLMGGGNMAVQTAVQHSNELTAERYRQFLQEAGVQLDDQQSAEDTALTEASDKYGAQAEVFRSTYAEGQDVALYDSAYRIAYEYGKAGAKEEAVMQQEDLSYLSETQRKIAYIAGREAAAWQNGLGENGSRAWAEVQNADVESKGKLQAGFTALYQAGLRRESAVNVKSTAASELPQSVQTAAYEAGLSDAAASLAREKAGLDFVSSAGSESGLVDNEYSRKMAKEQAGTAALLNTLGKNLGVRIEMVDTISGGKANGVYIGSKNLIRIAADANTAVEYVAAHEVTHRMQELAPEEYRAYRDHAMSYRARALGEETTAGIVARYMADAEDAGVKLTQEEAMDEIAANFTEDMMENGKLFENLAKENRSAAKKLLDALKAFIAKVKSLFRSKAAQDRAAQDAYGKSMAQLEQCVALWQKAYDAAGKQAQRAKNAAREGDGEGRYQIRREFMQEIDEWAEDGRPDGETFILGSTGPVLQGLGAIENDIFMESAKINKILVDHPEMTLEEIKRVPQILEDPVMVLKSKTRANSIVVFGTYRAQNGNPILAAMDLLPMKNRIFISGMQKVSSTYTKTGSRTQTAEEVGAAFLNSSEVLFLDKKRATPVLRRMGIYTPISILRNGYIGSIAYKGNKVNIQSVPFAEVVDSGMQAKFSLKKPLEETKNLLALHNLTEKNLLDAVRLGGLPMPSIAVVKGDAGHSEYGPISFVFSKDTIDPQLFRSNKVYGYDAWTPTAPQIEYEVNEKAAGRIHDLFYRMQREKGRDFANPLYSVANTLEDELNRKGGLDNVVEPMRDDPRVMNIYLEDTGRGAVEKVMRQNVSRMDEGQQEMSEFLIRELGADIVDGFRATGSEAPIAARRRWFAEHGEALNEALRKYYEKLGLPAKDAADVVNAETNAAKTKYLLNTRKYLSGNTETVTEEVDLDATNNAIRKKVDKADYDRWLDELFKGVVKNEGIYNGKDYFTSSGNRRSFSATHYEITLENIVKAMKRGDQKGTNTFFGGQAIWGVASKDYNSIDEIKADSGRLVKMTEEEYSAIRQEYSARLAELANEIKDPSARNDFIASDDAATAIVETLRTKRTAAAIDKELRTYPTLHIRPGTAGKVLQLFEDISNMPTGYFEAKPQRAVGFDEVLAAVIPDDTSAGARAALAQAGVKTIEYKSGDEQSRTDAVNSVEGARFQLKSATELEKEVRELKKERRALENRNRVLTERVAKWRGELRRTETPSVRPGDVKKLGRQFLSDYGSSTDYRAIEGDMTALGKALMADNVSMDTLRPHARAAAEKIIDGVLVQSESGGELLAIRDHLKNVTLRYIDDGSIPDFKDWRRANRRTLKISDKSGLDVDVAYSELTEMFGEGYFPSTIIHPGDQLLRMSEVLDNVGRIYENPFDGYRDAAVTELSDLLIDGMIGEDVRQSNPTFADRQALELQETKARLTQMLIKTREGRDRQVERMRRHYQEQTKAGRERRNATALRAKIARHTADLSRKLLTPTDKQHIPEKLRQSVAALLGSINQESAYSIKPGTEHYVIRKNGTRGGLTGVHVANGEGLPTARTQAALALKNAYDEIRNSGEFVLDPALLGDESTGLLDQVMAFGNKRIADMNSEELTTVWQAVRAIEQSVSTFNKNLAIERYAGVQELAEALRDGSFSRKRANRKLVLDLYDPYTFFSAFGEPGKQLFRTLRNAQDRQNTMLKTIQAAAEKFMDKEVYKNRLERHEFFVGEDGQRLVLTTEQIMNFCNTMGNGEQALRHVTMGGIRQPEIKKNGKQPAIKRGTEDIRLTVDDVAAITGTLSEAQRKVAEGFQRIASGYLAKQGNEASMTVYGYEKFTNDNYWPIKAAPEGTKQDTEKNPNVAREIKNVGIAKARNPNANNALEIEGIYDVFARHASDMIQYSTLLAPMEDMNRLFNYRYRNAKGNLTGKTVKDVLTDVYGEGSVKYWEDLMRDVQNGIKGPDGAMERLINKVVGNAKAASVGFNFRVVIQQPTAYVRAAAILDPSTMAKGIVGGATEGNGWEKAMKFAPIASIKDTAGFDQSSRYSVAQNVYGSEGGVLEWLNDKSGWLAGKADAVTWAAIWNACEWTVVNEGGYETGSDAFFSRVAQVFTEVIDQSQVVDGILQRAPVMRKPDLLMKQATAFMGEPLKTLNMFMRSYDAWRFEQNIPKRSAAMKKMTRTIGAVLVTDVVNALAQSVMDAFRDDDKDKGYWARYLEKLTGFTGDKEKDTLLSVLWGSNIWDNIDPMGRIPFAKDVKSIMQGFTVNRMDSDVVETLVSAAKMFLRSTQDEGKKTTLYAAKQLLAAASNIFGVSVANMGRDVWAIARSIAQSSGNIRVMYEMERAIWRLAPDAGNNTRYYKLLYMAMEQDKEAYQYIYEDMKKRGYSDGQLQKGIKSVIQDSGASDADMRKQLEDIGYSGEEAQEVMDKWAFKEKYGYAYDEKRDAFVEGAISRRQLIDEMVSIDGKTRDEAAAYVTQLQCEVDTGISYNDLRGAYSAGRIRYDQAVSYLKRYGGKDDESATNTVERWKFTGDIDEYNDISVEAVAKYNEYCASTGMSEDTYYRAWSVLHSITGEDYDGDGESDRYSKMDKKLAYIGSLNISYDQMFALALASGISEKRINERAPW